MFNIGDTVLHCIGTPYKATITKIYKNGNVELTITEVLKEGEFKDIVERHQPYNIKFKKSKEYKFEDCFRKI